MVPCGAMAELGIIGLGTMGANIARNAARNGAKVAVYNRTTEKTDAFIERHGAEGEFTACKTLDELKNALQPPRAILLMVQAGPAVDAVIDELISVAHIEQGDIIIDAGNSHYRDTERRVGSLKDKGIRFLGMGVSGGEEGALLGPSMMPGGDKDAFNHLRDLLEKMSADDGEGGKCVSFVGEGGSGHFVKTVHNGIEYGIMQLLAESYHVLKELGGYTNAELHALFAQWNDTPYLQSFLMEITAKIFAKKDADTGEPLVDLIVDAAKQKGTGKWTTEAAMNYGVAVPIITAAVDARIISGAKAFRMQRSTEAPFELLDVEMPSKETLALWVRSALELATMSAYAEGFLLLSTASVEEKWDLSFSEIARIWRGGCIIRSSVLERYQRMFAGDKDAQAELRSAFSGDRHTAWRLLTTLAIARGIPVPCLTASLSSYDAYRTARLPQNLVQAQRDFFGAHGFERSDKEGVSHGEWNA